MCQGDERAAITQLVCHVHYRPNMTSRWVRLAELLLSQFAETHQTQVTHCCQVAVSSSDIGFHSVCISTPLCVYLSLWFSACLSVCFLSCVYGYFSYLSMSVCLSLYGLLAFLFVDNSDNEICRWELTNCHHVSWWSFENFHSDKLSTSTLGLNNDNNNNSGGGDDDGHSSSN